MTLKKLAELGHSQREIARTLGVAESTIRYHLQRMEQGAIDGRSLQKQLAEDWSVAIEEYVDLLEDDGPVNLAAMHDWLVYEHDYPGSLRSVERYCEKHFPKPRRRARRRVETPPGMQAQADWAEWPPRRVPAGGVPAHDLARRTRGHLSRVAGANAPCTPGRARGLFSLRTNHSGTGWRGSSRAVLGGTRSARRRIGARHGSLRTGSSHGDAERSASRRAHPWIQPGSPRRAHPSRALELAGRYEQAIEEYRIGASLAPKGPLEPSSGLAHVYARMGCHDDTRKIVLELEALSRQRYVSPYGMASIYARMGEIDVSLDWLERAYGEHDQTLVWLELHPRLDPLRGEPRYHALLTKVELQSRPLRAMGASSRHLTLVSAVRNPFDPRTSISMDPPRRASIWCRRALPMANDA